MGGGGGASVLMEGGFEKNRRMGVSPSNAPPTMGNPVHLSGSLWGIPLRCDLFRRIDQ